MKILKVTWLNQKIVFSPNVERDAGFELIRIIMTPASPIHRGVFLENFSAPSSAFSGNPTFHGVCAPGLPPTCGDGVQSWHLWISEGPLINKILFNQRLPRIKDCPGSKIAQDHNFGDCPLPSLSQKPNWDFTFVSP